MVSTTLNWFIINNTSYTKQELFGLINNVLGSRGQDEWYVSTFQFMEEWFNNKSYIKVKTSGSTGKPKEIKLSKHSMEASALRTIKTFGLQEGDTLLLCLPANYIAGKMMIVRALVGGMNLMTIEPASDPFKIIKNKIDFAALTPYQLVNSIDTIKEKDIVKTIILGGAPVSSRLRDLIIPLRVNVFETYGMTETCSHVALKHTSKNETEFSVLEGVSISQNEHKCLVIEDKTTSSEILITNDVVEITSKKSFQWLGRLDNIINSGGIKLYPEHIEEKLQKHINYPLIIVGVPDSKLGEKIVLLIESKDTFDTLKILEQTKIVLEKYEQPKEIIVFPLFEYTANGKVNRKATKLKCI